MNYEPDGQDYEPEVQLAYPTSPASYAVLSEYSNMFNPHNAEFISTYSIDDEYTCDKEILRITESSKIKEPAKTPQRLANEIDLLIIPATYKKETLPHFEYLVKMLENTYKRRHSQEITRSASPITLAYHFLNEPEKVETSRKSPTESIHQQLAETKLPDCFRGREVPLQYLETLHIMQNK